MKREDNKFDFDLSALTLEELITVYNDVDDFIIFLESKKVEVEKKEENEK